MTTPTDPRSLIAKVSHTTECAAIAGYLMSELTDKIAVATSKIAVVQQHERPRP